MALELDGFETWRMIADHPQTFTRLRTEAAKTARSALSKLLKSRAVGLSEIRAIEIALGREAFILLVNGMKDSELKSVVGRLDRHHPEQKSAGADWRRRHLAGLAGGRFEPAPKPRPEKRTGGKSPAARRKAEATGMSYVSAGVTRKR